MSAWTLSHRASRLAEGAVQPARQPIHIAQRRRDGALFGFQSVALRYRVGEIFFAPVALQTLRQRL